MIEHIARKAEIGILGTDPDHDVFIVPVDDVKHMRDWTLPARVVIDARPDGAPTLPVLAQLVVLRRRLRAAGGDLVVAANPEAAAALRSTGLHWVMPCGDDLADALDEVRP